MTTIPVNDNTPYAQYVATAGQVSFPYDWFIFNDTDLLTYKNNDVVTNPTNYTVTGAGTEAGGNVVFNVGLSEGDIVTIFGSLAIERVADLQQGGKFDPDDYNLEQDRNIVIMKELRRDIDRKIGLDPTSTDDVAGLETAVLAVFDNLAIINDVNDNEANINIVAGLDAEIATVVANITDIQNAEENAALAAASATQLIGTSISSVAIGTGAKSFTTQSSKFFGEGTWLLITSNANEANYMHGRVTSYSGTALQVLVTNVGGTGTFTDWTIRVAGTQGATGATGATGSAGANGASVFQAAAGGTADAITATLSPTPANLGALTRASIIVSSATTNATATPTINFSGFGAQTIQKYAPSGVKCNLAVGDIPFMAEYSHDGTNPILLNPATFSKGATIASAGTVNLNTATGNYVQISGTTTITAITLGEGRQAKVKFDGILTLTNGASLILPTGANITTAAGDVAEFVGEASGVVRCTSYTRASGAALLTSGTTPTIQVFTSSGTWTKPANCKKVKVTVVGGGGGTDEQTPITSTAGGTTVFTGYHQATGGAAVAGGNNTSIQFGGAGGVGSGGDINLNGMRGIDVAEISTTSIAEINGGVSILPSYGNGARGSQGLTGGFSIGSAGSGGASIKYIDVTAVSTVTVTIGAAGAAGVGGYAGNAGICIVEEYY